MNLNKVQLIGRLGNAPEVKLVGQNSTPVAELSVATSESRKKGDEWHERTEWHRVKCWGDLADRCARLDKGVLVYVEGKLETSEWTTDSGEKRKKTEIVAFTVKRLEKQQKNDYEKASKNDDPDGLPF